MQFFKYHALGNDYLVIDPTSLNARLTPAQIKTICHRHYGIGSDGVLLGPLESSSGDVALRIFNPDGSEAEKSGNGLRIFARYLWDAGIVQSAPFTILTAGGAVTAHVHPNGRIVTVEMGRISFDSATIPVAGLRRDVIDEALEIEGQTLRYCAATIGNPHCVVLRDHVSAAEAQQLGPLIEVDPRFPHRTNVQFMQIVDRATIRIEIWEHGAGYTLASGSSSCAAAAVAHRLGLCDASIAVHMPGGTITIAIGDDWTITMTGGVTRIGAGTLDSEMFATNRGETDA